jgi:hypothetical protein
MKGIGNDLFECPKCHAERTSEEYDTVEDCCLFCLFPETSDRRPAEFNELGLNETQERVLLDNLDYIPTKQSETAEKSLKAFKTRNYRSKKG